MDIKLKKKSLASARLPFLRVRLDVVPQNLTAKTSFSNLDPCRLIVLPLSTGSNPALTPTPPLTQASPHPDHSPPPTPLSPGGPDCSGADASVYWDTAGSQIIRISGNKSLPRLRWEKKIETTEKKKNTENKKTQKDWHKCGVICKGEEAVVVKGLNDGHKCRRNWEKRSDPGSIVRSLRTRRASQPHKRFLRPDGLRPGKLTMSVHRLLRR
jgi:hypothetical protein